MAETTTPTVDPSLKTWTVNGKPLAVRTGTIKTGDNKGKPTFRILTAGVPDKTPTFAQVTGVLAQLNIADDVAPLIDREIIQDLAKEVATRIVGEDGKGGFTLNEGKVAEFAKKVIAEYLEQKAGKDQLRAELGELQAKQGEIMQQLMGAVAQGKDIRSPDFAPLTNKATQIALKVSEITQKLNAAAQKKAKKAAAAAAAPAVAQA